MQNHHLDLVGGLGVLIIHYFVKLFTSGLLGYICNQEESGIGDCRNLTGRLCTPYGNQLCSE